MEKINTAITVMNIDLEHRVHPLSLDARKAILRGHEKGYVYHNILWVTNLTEDDRSNWDLPVDFKEQLFEANGFKFIPTDCYAIPDEEYFTSLKDVIDMFVVLAQYGNTYYLDFYLGDLKTPEHLYRLQMNYEKEEWLDA